ncbi:CD63 antigen-like [Arctopsyche grandis]|uniref:CD63 antigen-like n=1 Tax=Arctopsyche grandis TaxID=121162 RepID=UPI00406D7F8B
MDVCSGLLFWFSLALSLFGLGTFAIGLIVQFVYFSGADLIESNFLSTPSLLIFTGAIIFIVALLGCCGATKENYCMLMTFGILMLILFVIGLAGGIACYVKRGQLEDVLENKLNETMHLYPTDSTFQKSWDIMQHELQCCGDNGPSDWLTFGNKTIPISCCKEAPFDENTKQASCPETLAFTSGCFPLLLEGLQQQSVILGSVAIIVAALQMVVVIFACYLAGSVRRDYQTV